MRATLPGHSVTYALLDPVSVTSDGATGNYIDYNGWNYAMIGCQMGLVATGDSDDTMGFQLYRVDDIAAASAAASDHVAITAALATLGPTADTTVEGDIEIIHLDFQQHALDNGCLVLVATASEGCAAASSAFITLYGRNGTLSDTISGKTITVPASS